MSFLRFHIRELRLFVMSLPPAWKKTPIVAIGVSLSGYRKENPWEQPDNSPKLHDFGKT